MTIKKYYHTSNSTKIYLESMRQIVELHLKFIFRNFLKIKFVYLKMDENYGFLRKKPENSMNIKLEEIANF